MSEIKLLPCPFCGGEAELVRQHSGVSDKIYIVSCKNEECEASLGHFCESKEMAITEWNTRKPMERIIERLEEQENQYTRRGGEYRTKGNIKESRRNMSKASSYHYAIQAVKEEGGIE